jgi:hypothetical protein
MNKSYKTVWNETTGTYVAASETAKSRGEVEPEPEGASCRIAGGWGGIRHCCEV